MVSGLTLITKHFSNTLDVQAKIENLFNLPKKTRKMAANDLEYDRRMSQAMVEEFEMVRTAEWEDPSQFRISDMWRHVSATTFAKHCFNYFLGTRFKLADMVIGMDFDGSLFAYGLALDFEMGFASLQKMSKTETLKDTVLDFIEKDGVLTGYALDEFALSRNRFCVIICGVMKAEKVKLAFSLINKLGGVCLGAIGLVELKEDPIIDLDIPYVAITAVDEMGNFWENVVPEPQLVTHQ